MDLAKGKRSLKAYKGHLTRVTNNCEVLLGQTHTDVVELQATIKTLVTRWEKYDEAFTTVETLLLESADCETEIETLQNDYYDLHTKYQTNITKMRIMVQSLTPQNNRESTTQQASGTAASARPKLPTIQLPTFSGELTEYEAFIDQFQAQVGSRPDLEPVTKLQYLKSQLKGRALDLVKGYTSISANYQSALDALKETYGDEEKIKHCLLQKIANLQQPKHNRAELESFRVNLLNLTRSLSNKHDYSCCEWIIASLFQHRLPTTTIRQLYLKYDRNYFDLTQLNEGIRDLTSHMESENQQRQNQGLRPDTKCMPQDRVKEHQIGTYFTTNPQAKSNKANTDQNCRFCGSAHKDSVCTRYSTGQERIQRLKELKLCTRCMGKHPVKSCSVKLQTCRKCLRGSHHTTLCKSYDGRTHPSTVDTTQVSTQDPSNAQQSQQSTTTNVNHINITAGATTTQHSGVALATAKATLEQSGEGINLFFDTGSQKTFITKNIVQKTGMTIKSTVKMTLKGFMSQENTQDFHIVKPVIKMGNRKKRITAVVVDELPQTIMAAGLTEVTKALTSKRIKLATPIVHNDRVGPIDVLIGADHYYDFISPHTIMREGVHLLQSPSGYIITGKIPNTYKSAMKSSNMSQVIIPESVIVMRVTDHINPLVNIETHLENEESSIHKLWDLDVIGIDPTQPLPDDKTSYQEYLNTVKYDTGQYWVKLPWKVNKPDLPINYKKSQGQMYSLVKELTKKGQVDNYQKVITEQLESNFIEEVSDAQPNNKTHYLPHHAVFKESATTPLRIVFNCSSKENPQSHSLNDCLMTGPTLTKRLGDVLLSYRTNRFAYTADISKAFLRIGLQEEDRDFTRFLWLSDPNNLDSPVKTYRFKSVLFGATSSPFLLQATIDYHLRKSTSPIKELLASNFYVDNFQGSTTDESSLIHIYNEATKELRLANMPLRQWTTNNPKLQEQINKDFPDYEIPTTTSVLGLQWNTENDTMTVKPVKCSQPEITGALTKRSLLAKVSKLFDPLGLFSPIAIKGKILLQESWKLKIGWDDILPEFYHDEWKCLEAEYQQLHLIHLPRSVANDNEPCVLHIFCDASLKAYGAVAYIVTRKHSLLLTSKARVAPIKSRTIPQMELTALVIGNKLGVYIHQTLDHLNITETVLWSDNEAAIQWIRNDNSKLPYVKNRVADIQESPMKFTIMHVGTKSNPADLLSRGASLKQLTKNSLWFQGTDWLTDRTQWPEQKSCIVAGISSLDEVETDTDSQHAPLIDPTRFSSLGKLLRVTGHVLKFISNICKRKGWTRRSNITCPTTFWVQMLQREIYHNELKVLRFLSSSDPDDQLSELSTKTLRASKGTQSDTELSTKTLGYKLINQLGLFLDQNNLVRCRGRIHNSSLGYGSKHPILLPKTHWFTKLVITDAHQKTLHGGVADTLVYIRKGFWIPKARQAIKSTIRKCNICRRYDSRPLKYPGPPPLPKERIQESRPFEIVGVDYSGALQLQNPSNEDRSEPKKVYICLFTCATTRAVHLELVTDMSAITFLRAFRRFAGRRSCPSLVISDNGSNFRAAEGFLKRFFIQPEVQEFFKSRRCAWKFIPPRAPWQGGFYERMIGVVKKCLRKVLHNKRISVDELQTVLVEIEARINNRPLTYVQDAIDEPQPLTPNHLLQGSPIESIPPIINKDYDADPDFLLKIKTPNVKELNSRFNHLNKLLKQWNRVWQQDYLTSLREYHYGGRAASTSCKLSPGDIVLIDSDTPRSSWPLGKIVSLLPDKNGTVRIVKVLSKGSVSLRTVEKLIPLEVRGTATPEEINDATPRQERPKRQAAIDARARWQD